MPLSYRIVRTNLFNTIIPLCYLVFLLICIKTHTEQWVQNCKGGFIFVPVWPALVHQLHKKLYKCSRPWLWVRITHWILSPGPDISPSHARHHPLFLIGLAWWLTSLVATGPPSLTSHSLWIFPSIFNLFAVILYTLESLYVWQGTCFPWPNFYLLLNLFPV